MRVRFVPFAVAAVVLVGTSPVAAEGVNPGVTLVAHWTGSKWVRVASPNAHGGALLNSVFAVSRKNIWAVGLHGQGEKSKPLIEHWNGSSWSKVSGPAEPGGSSLNGVAGFAAPDLWAVGTDGANPLILHGNGSAWQSVAAPQVQNGELMAVDAVSASDAWAVGTRGTSKTLAVHWDGQNWKTVATPSGKGNNFLFGVIDLGPTNAWAVGSTGGGVSAATKSWILHWNGAKWSHVPSINVGNVYTAFASVTGRGANNLTAAGAYINGKGCLQTLIEHWNGTAWKRVASPNAGPCDSELKSVVQDGKHLWAVGTRADKPNSSPITVGMALVKKHGHWRIQDSRIKAHKKLNELHGVTVAPGTSSVWAVGVGSGA